MDIKKAESLANLLMRRHGLIQKGWVFKYDRAKRRFGQCDYENKVISLSKDLTILNNEDEVKNVIIHEIAHALVPHWVQSHGRIWKAKCRELGIKPERCSGPGVIQPKGKYYRSCCECGEKIYFINKPKKNVKRICPECWKKYKQKRRIIDIITGKYLLKKLYFILIKRKIY